MPRKQGRYDMVKVLRPRGARYATGEQHYRGDGFKAGAAKAAFGTALMKALQAFEKEFGERPNDEVTVIEGSVSYGRVSVTVIEIGEPEDADTVRAA